MGRSVTQLGFDIHSVSHPMPLLGLFDLFALPHGLLSGNTLSYLVPTLNVVGLAVATFVGRGIRAAGQPLTIRVWAIGHVLICVQQLLRNRVPREPRVAADP